jgi:hypothetical protein
MFFGSIRFGRQFEARHLFDLSEEDRGLDLDRAADIENTSQRGVGLAKLNEADESSFVARPGRKRLLTHLQPNSMLPQRLSER